MEKESILIKILKALGSILFCLILLLCAVVFIFNQIFEYHGVYGTSMAPTLNAESEDADAIYIRKNIPCEIGDMIVAQNPYSSKHVIKRLLGLSGDKIAVECCTEGFSFVYKIWIIKAGATEPMQFKLAGKDYLESSALFNDLYTTQLSKKDFENINGLSYLVVPDGFMFFISEGSSNDCAEYGAIPYKNYIGKVEYVIYGRKNFISQIIAQTYDKIFKK